MPQKSTFFYPKVLTGLAIHTLEPAAASRRLSAWRRARRASVPAIADAASASRTCRALRSAHATNQARYFASRARRAIGLSRATRFCRPRSLSPREVQTMSEKKQPPRRRRTPEDEAVQFGDELPVLPIRNAVLFPGAVAPFDVGREKSVALVEDVDNLTVARHRHLRAARSVDRRSGQGRPAPGRLRGARPQGAQAQLGQLLAHPAGAHAHPASTR